LQSPAWLFGAVLVKEYDIRLAIHNHGTGSVYGDPATVRQVLAKRDRRIGVCLDVGWVTAAGFDAAAVFRDYGDRVYDMHFKDKVVETAADGKKTPVDTEIGKGKSNYAGLFAEIKRTGWSGVMAIETDSRTFAEDPNRLVAEAKTFFAHMIAGH
jgi:sugar phosphate isomerase/epimerase